MTPPQPLLEQRTAVPDAVPALRHAVVTYAHEVGAPEDVVRNVKLAVTEAITNAVMHAYVGMEPGPIALEAWVEPETLVVTVRDDGHGMRPRVDSPGLGLGLPLIAQMADEVDVVDRADRSGTMLRMLFSLASARQAEMSRS